MFIVTISLESEGAIPCYDNGCCFNLPSPLFITSCVTRKVPDNASGQKAKLLLPIPAEAVNVNAK